MAWKSKITWHDDALPKPQGQDLDNYGLDIRTWGAAVDAGGFNLTNLAELHGASATNILKFFTSGAEAAEFGAAGHLDLKTHNLSNVGIITAPGQLRCRADATGAQSVNDSTWTPIALGAESFDVGSMHDNATNNTRITIPAGGGGLYLIVGRTSWAASAAGTRQTEIKKNGADYLGGSPAVPAVAGLPQHAVTTVITSLAAADYVELMGYQTSGGALNTYLTSSFLTVVKIA